MELYIGITLIVLGIVLIAAGRMRSKRVNVQASNGSVAIGGNNSGPIVNTNIATSAAPASHGGHGLTVVGVIVELAGIATTLWHAWHLAHS